MFRRHHAVALELPAADVRALLPDTLVGDEPGTLLHVAQQRGVEHGLISLRRRSRDAGRAPQAVRRQQPNLLPALRRQVEPKRSSARVHTEVHERGGALATIISPVFHLLVHEARLAPRVGVPFLHYPVEKSADKVTRVRCVCKRDTRSPEHEVPGELCRFGGLQLHHALVGSKRSTVSADDALVCREVFQRELDERIRRGYSVDTRIRARRVLQVVVQITRRALSYELVVMPSVVQLRGAVPAPELFVRRRDELAPTGPVILRREESHRARSVRILSLVPLLRLPFVSPLERHLLPRELFVRLLVNRAARAPSSFRRDPLNLPSHGPFLPLGDEGVRI